MRKIILSIIIVTILIMITFYWIKPIDGMNYVEDIKPSQLIQYRIEKQEKMGQISEIADKLPGNLCR